MNPVFIGKVRQIRKFPLCEFEISRFPRKKNNFVQLGSEEIYETGEVVTVTKERCIYVLDFFL